jgi:cell division transport system ATP-binding protein
MDNIVTAKGIRLEYGNGESIIKEGNLKITGNDFIFITGKSGSGKSTLVKSLYGALKPVGGELEVCGFDMRAISGYKMNFLRKYVGVVFQDYKLIKEWTVEKNIYLPLMINGYSKSVCEAQTEKLLRHVQLLHKANKHPLELSGGEQQRVAMARALAHNPILILADEPTGNLDDYSSTLIWELLKGAKEQLGSTVLVVTHKIPASLSVDYKHYHIEDGVIYEVP